MEHLDRLVEKAVQDGVYSGCAIAAADKSGKLSYQKAFGKAGTSEDSDDFTLDTVLQIASMTKLLTTIAALQLVERGQVGLDDDVVKYIPELVEQGVLEDVKENGKPITVPIEGKLTLRHLLTHSAGCTYSATHPGIQKIKQYNGHSPMDGATFEDKMTYPLLYQPGTSWMYGTSIDWAGRVVERISGVTLEAYMRDKMWPQLGIKDFAFFPDDDMKKRLAQMTARDKKSGGVKPYTMPFLNDGSKDCFGGHGGYCTIREYIKVLQSVLLNDGKLLGKATVDSMFEPQLSTESRAALEMNLSTPEIVAWFIGDFPHPDRYDWGLGGIILSKDLDGRRKKGTLIWSGYPNCFWFIDREAGVCGVFGSQVVPPGDLKVEETIKALEFGVNEFVAKL